MSTTENNGTSLTDQMAMLHEARKMLNEKLEEFPSRKIGFKEIAEGSGVSDRTLRRILNQTHTTSYQSIFKLYRYFFGLLNDRDTFKKMPKKMQEFVMKEYGNFSLTNSDSQWLPIIDEYLITDSVFRGIYIETACGPLSKERVAYEFGKRGLSILDKMCNLNVIRETESGIYIASTDRATLGPKAVKQISATLVENYFNEDKLDLRGENIAQMLFEGVDAYTFNELLKIDHRANNERLEVLKNAGKGNIPYWHVSISDTLRDELIYKDEDAIGGLQ